MYVKKPNLNANMRLMRMHRVQVSHRIENVFREILATQ